ncbi:alpha/beta fold hydrolase, partial [Myxococcota bacterium]
MRADHHPFKSDKAKQRYLERYALRAAAWPVAHDEKTVKTSYGTTFVRTSGPKKAAPLVMLPGIGSPGLTFIANVERLSQRYRTIAVDCIWDNGRSVADKSLTCADDFTAWLDELFDGLGLETVNLLGLSYGGWQAVHYALRFPERVAKLVLLAPAGTTANIPWGFIWRALLCLIPARFFMANFMNWIITDAEATESGKRLLEEMVDDAYLAQRCFKSRKMVPPLPLAEEQWKSLSVPTLFLAGDKEVIFPPHEAVEKLAVLAPETVRAELLDNAGHDFFAVRAKEVDQRVLS